jgi:hypothetical protein
MGWCALIAATSSTVILPHDFFVWLGAHIFTDDASFRRFVDFWDYSWFAIVKGWHAAEFAVLFLLVHALLERYDRRARLRNLVLAATLGLLFAISDEYHQTFVPGRGGTWSDVAIDSLGIVLVASLAWLRGSRA